MKIKIENFNTNSLAMLAKKMKLVKRLNSGFYFEITPNGISSRCAFDRKYIKAVDFEWCDFTEKTVGIDSNIKVAFGEQAPKFLEMLAQFKDTKTTLTIDYVEVDINGETFNYATKLTFKSDKLSYVMKTTDYTVLGDSNDSMLFATDATMNRAFAETNVLSKFTLSGEDLTKFRSLCKISAKDFYTLKKVGNQVYIHSGSDFKLVIDDFNEGGEDFGFDVNVAHLDTLCVESYNVTVCELKLMLSNEFNTNRVLIPRRLSDENDMVVEFVED